MADLCEGVPPGDGCSGVGVLGGGSGEWQQRVEARTQTTSLRMLFPRVFLIFPAMYVIVRSPAIPQVVGTFGGS